MTHIGIDARLLYYRTGGISTYIRRLIEQLAMLDVNDQFTVFQSRKAQHPITTVFKEAKLWTPAHHRIERVALSVELLRHRLDVFHSPDFIPPYHGAKRHIITVHDLTFLHYPEHKDMASIRYYKDQIEAAVNHADHILSVSETTKQDLITMLGVPSEKITVQPHGVDTAYRPYTPNEMDKWREKLGLPKDYILHVSTLEPRKNIPTLLDAYMMLKDAPSLVLVGRPGWLFDETMVRIKSLQEQGVPIIIRSDIDDEALPAVYNMASVLVMPSFYEGFGMPPLEAMACGVPVVVSNVSSLPEVVGDVGLMIDAHDADSLKTALEQALGDTEWRKNAIKGGLERAKLFTWEQSAQIAVAVYKGK